MSARRNHKLAILGVAVLAPLVLASAAQASDEPTHIGNPNQWGPPLAALCADPGLAAAAGYNLILGNGAPNVLAGGAGADAIYSFGGNDIVTGGPGPDLICLGWGNDKGDGQQGNDAVFGEPDRDRLRGSVGRDWLDGGTQFDQCDGGPHGDGAAACEVVANVP